MTLREESGTTRPPPSDLHPPGTWRLWAARFLPCGDVTWMSTGSPAWTHARPRCGLLRLEVTADLLSNSVPNHVHQEENSQAASEVMEQIWLRVGEAFSAQTFPRRTVKTRRTKRLLRSRGPPCPRVTRTREAEGTTKMGFRGFDAKLRGNTVVDLAPLRSSSPRDEARSLQTSGGCGK